MTSKAAPMKNGVVKEANSNRYPEIVGLKELKNDLAELLIPNNVPV